MLCNTQQPDQSPMLSKELLPAHVAIIMDGNGRWAQQHNKPRLWGHQQGVESVREVVRVAGELGIQVLTLYAFSEENWGRPASEVAGIMSLLDTFVLRERHELHANRVSLRTMGDIARLPVNTQRNVAETVSFLKDNNGLTLNIALSYGSKSEISQACKAIAAKIKANELDVDDISPELIEDFLWTRGLPSPDLLIRTSGEQRLSNFLLWQLAYCELWFTPVYWPDFRKEHFLEALGSYQQRQRRYGLIESAQQAP